MKQQKFTVDDLIGLNIHDTGGERVSPNLSLRKREPRVDQKGPREKYDVFRGVPETLSVDAPTEKPFLSLKSFQSAALHEVFLLGEAWQTESGFNYAGRGTHIRFVCVKGRIDWAMYAGPAIWSQEKVATDGDKVLCSKIEQLVFVEGPRMEGAETPLDFYRH